MLILNLSVLLFIYSRLPPTLYFLFPFRSLSTKFFVKMESSLVVTLKIEELKSIINESVENAIRINSKPNEEDSLLCRKDLARLFSVSLVTISAWTKSGKLPYHRMGSRIYFKKSEIMQIFNSNVAY